MSWVEKLQNPFKITTGDGKVFTPLQRSDTNKGSFDFNISEFHYPEVEGTHVDRRLKKGTRYPLEFYFVGEDNLDQLQDFINSSRDTRPWVVLHPAFGQITAHPLSIEFDSSAVSHTKISTTLVETILDGGPQVIKSTRESALKSSTQAVESQEAFAATIQPSASDVSTMSATANQMYLEGVNGVTDDIVGAQYFNAFTKAENAINNAMNDFNTGVTFLNDFITYPSQFLIGVKLRLQLLKAQALKLSATLENLENKYSKQLFEAQKGAIVATVINSVLNPLEGDYQSAVDVLFIIEQTLGIYNDFIDELQELQSTDPTQEDTYAPNADFMYNLNFAVNYAVSNLFSIAMTAQQERIVYLLHDSNVIIEAHKYYGLNADDSNLMRFVNTNNIQLNEVILLPKGRKIVYYV